MAEPSSSVQKNFITADDLLKDSFELALRIYESGFRPTFILGVWRGGAPVGIAVQEVLETLNCPTQHFAIRTASYGARVSSFDADEDLPDVQVYGLEQVTDLIGCDDRLLIIDDIFDSGRSIDAILKALQKTCAGNLPERIQVATLYFKPKRNLTERIPDIYVHETDSWTVFPHELRGSTVSELRQRGTMPERYFKLDPEL